MHFTKIRIRCTHPIRFLILFCLFLSAVGCELTTKKSASSGGCPGSSGGSSGGSPGSGSPANPAPPAYAPTPTAPPAVSFGVTNDTYFGFLWGLHNEGQTNGKSNSHMDMRRAWSYGTDCSAILVGIIDTGIDASHKDLDSNIWTNPLEIAGNGVDDDGNGYVDDTYGWNFYAENNSPFDDHSHGTHVAGTIGAEGNNNQGMSGVCWKARMMALKFLNSNGSGTLTDAVEAITYASQMGVKITNNSWGGGSYTQYLKDAIENAGDNGMLFVASAGNSGLNADYNPSYPGSLNSSNIISVAATDKYDDKAYFSNYGKVSVDLGAPGRDIFSTIPGNAYTHKSGTSMAAPHVTGAAALYWSMHQERTVAEVKQRMLATVDHIPSMKLIVVSDGRLNVANMLDENFDEAELPLDLELSNDLGTPAEDVAIALMSLTEGVNIASVNQINVKAVDVGQVVPAGQFQLAFDDSIHEDTLITLRIEIQHQETTETIEVRKTRNELLGSPNPLQISLN